MLESIKRLFQRPEVEDLSLEFEVDTDEDGQHAVRIYRHRGEVRELIKDIEPLCRYGYLEEDPERRKVYVLGEHDLQTLRSIMSMNPGLSHDGTLVSEVVPSILRYWRRGKRVAEGEGSQQLKIQEKPLQPAITVDFNPSSGLELRAGYLLAESGQIVEAEQVKSTRDDGFVRVGDTFAPLPRRLSAQAQRLLGLGSSVHVSLDGIPEFFQRDLVLIKKEFKAVLTDLAAQIEIIDEPLHPL